MLGLCPSEREESNLHHGFSATKRSHAMAEWLCYPVVIEIVISPGWTLAEHLSGSLSTSGRLPEHVCRANREVVRARF
jgi:hypothetical protein